MSMVDKLAAELGSFSGDKISPATAKPYSYRQLKGQHTIRLLELRPSEIRDSDELFGRLIEVKIHDEPSYEAISYTWGNPVFDHLLQLLNGHLIITKNLASALRRFRSIDSANPQFLWAYQICINQADVLERNQQVSIMSEIYKNADKVLAWLGVGDGETNATIAMLKEIAAAAESCGVQRVEGGMVYSQDGPRNPVQEEKAMEDLGASTDYAKLRSFYESPWFSRVWICQEIALPPEVTFFYGPDEINNDELAIATFVLHRMIQSYKIEFDDAMSVAVTRCLNVIGLRDSLIWQKKVKLTAPDQSPQIDVVTDEKGNTEDGSVSFKKPASIPIWKDEKLLDHVAAIGFYNFCSDDRDRVYALVSLRSESDVDIKPDYDLSLYEVYTDFARKYLLSQEVGILKRAGLALHSANIAQDSSTIPCELPSWVPDWRIPRPLMLADVNRNIYTAGFELRNIAWAEEQSRYIEIGGLFLSQGIMLPISASSETYSFVDTFHVLQVYMRDLAILLEQRKFFTTQKITSDWRRS